MDVEFVSFSSATVATLRRLVSNVAATHPDVQHRSIRRTSRAYTQRIGAGSQAESWLTQRHWRVTGERLTFVGTRDGARSALLELLSPVATSSAGNQRTSPVAASAELVARVRSTIVELTSKGLWFFKWCATCLRHVLAGRSSLSCTVCSASRPTSS